MKSTLSSAGVALFLMFLAATSWAQERRSAQDLFGEIVDVRVVNVEVVVTDRSGERVTGLLPEDFELLVDGVPTAIDYFAEYSQGRSSTQALAQPPAASADLPVNYLVYIDDNRTLPVRRERVLRNMREQLAAMRPNDQMAVVVHSGSGLEVLADWTSSRSELDAALQEASDVKLYPGSLRNPFFRSRQRLARGASDVSRAVPSSGGFGRLPFASMFGFDLPASAPVPGQIDYPNLPSFSAIAQADYEARELELAVSAVVSTMQGFSRPVGRNVLLLLGGDWPSGAFYSKTSTLSKYLVTELTAVETLTDTANLLGYTVYPVEVNTAVGSLDDWAAMRQMARQTGGRLLVGGLEMQAFATAAEDTATFYWLGFAPPRSADDRQYDLQVRVQRPGTKVRARKGYVDFSRSTRADFATQGALLFADGGEPAEAEPLQLAFEEPVSKSRRRMVVPVEIRIPIATLDLLADEGVDNRLELRFAAIDRNGQQAEIAPVPITVPGELVGVREHVVVRADLTLRKEPHRIAATVTDGFGTTVLQATGQIAP